MAWIALCSIACLFPIALVLGGDGERESTMIAVRCSHTGGAAVPVPQSLNARIIQVRHRSHATYSRQPRQVRKEATVTGSCVCSGVPVPGLIFAFHKILSGLKTTCRKKSFTSPLQLFAQETRPRFVSNRRF